MPDHNTPRFGLPYIMPAQAQKHVTHNETLNRLDAQLPLIIRDDSLREPPIHAREGDHYRIAQAGGLGVWAEFSDGDIVNMRAGNWVEITSNEGDVAYVLGVAQWIIFNGSDWQITGIPSLYAPMFGVNTDADITNRLAVKSDAILISHDDITPGSGDIRVNINKDTSSNSAALLFQSGYSARAEIGLMGDDALSVKVSPDGAAFHTALTIDPETGACDFPQTSIGAINVISLTSGTGRYVPPEGLAGIVIVIIGAGGGGAGGRTETTGEFVGAGGGGSGGYIRHIISAEHLANSYDYTVGAGGAGGNADAADPLGSRDGSDGGDSTFMAAGLSLAAHGGGGAPEDLATAGLTQFVGGTGGTATGGQLNVHGQNGGGGITKNSDYYQIGLGAGAATTFGQGGSYQNGNGQTGKGYGSGGSGCGMIPGLVLNRSGGAGRDGLILIEERFR